MAKEKLRIAFFGTPDFAATALKALCENPATTPIVVITQPDRPAGRGGKLNQSPVKTLALSHNIPLLQPEKLRNNQEFLTSLKQYAPLDLAVVVAFGQIIPQDLLTLPKAGFVNIHASLLPRWRGAAPMQRAILAQDKETGISLMRLEAGLDSGPVFATEKIPLTPEDDFGTIHDKLAEIGAKLLSEKIFAISASTLTALPQTESGITYAEKISNEESAINWQQDADTIAAQIRAFSPFPGAFTFIFSKRLKIFKATPKPQSFNGMTAKAGEIVYCDKKKILEIQCGSGVLSIQELQLEGKRRMNINEFINGNPVATGILLSNKA